MNIELNYFQAMLLKDLVKNAKAEASTEAYTINDRFKANDNMTSDEKQYWAYKQDQANNSYDNYSNILEALREATGTR
jgi:hypothetical protein